MSNSLFEPKEETSPMQEQPADTSKYTINELFKELSQDKEEFKIPDQPQEEYQKEIQEKPDSNKQKFTSMFITKNIDRALAFGASAIAMDDETDPYKAGADDLKDLDTIIYEMIKDSSFNLPPWFALIVALVMIYAPVYKEAFTARRINKKLLEKATSLELEKEMRKEKARQREEQEADKEEETVHKEAVNEHILKLRSKGMTFRDIAEVCEVNYKYVQKLINKEGDPYDTAEENKED